MMRMFRPRERNILIAATMNFTLFKFFISQRVPEPGVEPMRFMETFTSQRSEPYGTTELE